MKINWKVRFKNKVFWMLFIPALLVLIKSAASVFGFVLDLGELENNLIRVVEAVFVILGLVGIVVDPTTDGIKDSENALTYDTPKK